MMIQRRSFTLVELVCAMLIMMVVGLIIGTAGSALYNGYRRSVESTAKLNERMAIDRIWDSALVNMIPFKWKDENNESRYVFEGKSDELLLTTMRRIYGNDPTALTFIRFKVEDEKLIAEYSFYPILPWEEDEPTAEIQKEVIADNISHITFQYVDRDDAGEIEWLEEWEEEEHNDLPLAIRMCVEWKDGTKEYWLRRTCGVNYNSTFGNRSAATSTRAQRSSSGSSRNTGGRRGR